jgi:elongation factor Ts
MSVSIDQIKQLRSQTKAGIMEARQALTESDGDIKKAKEWLIKKGFDKAAKKADRETGEGIIEAYIHSGGRIAAMVKLACETDFVARTDDFKTLAREIAMQIASMNPKNVKALLKQAYIRDNQKTIGDLINETIAKLGENVVLKDFCRMEI